MHLCVAARTRQQLLLRPPARADRTRPATRASVAGASASSRTARSVHAVIRTTHPLPLCKTQRGPSRTVGSPTERRRTSVKIRSRLQRASLATRRTSDAISADRQKRPTQSPRHMRGATAQHAVRQRQRRSLPPCSTTDPAIVHPKRRRLARATTPTVLQTQHRQQRLSASNHGSVTLILSLATASAGHSSAPPPDSVADRSQGPTRSPPRGAPASDKRPAYDDRRPSRAAPGTSGAAGEPQMRVWGARAAPAAEAPLRDAPMSREPSAREGPSRDAPGRDYAGPPPSAWGSRSSYDDRAPRDAPAPAAGPRIDSRMAEPAAVARDRRSYEPQTPAAVVSRSAESAQLDSRAPREPAGRSRYDEPPHASIAAAGSQRPSAPRQASKSGFRADNPPPARHPDLERQTQWGPEQLPAEARYDSRPAMDALPAMRDRFAPVESAQQRGPPGAGAPAINGMRAWGAPREPPAAALESRDVRVPLTRAATTLRTRRRAQRTALALKSLLVRSVRVTSMRRGQLVKRALERRASTISLVVSTRSETIAQRHLRHIRLATSIGELLSRRRCASGVRRATTPRMLLPRRRSSMRHAMCQATCAPSPSVRRR
ncbi:hypothetical protein FA09DRAFT_96345 [Tilletiopsis washingtonensis]|uniref:Uncharacterized protein n=1 Tax=Tilletiopsis washingtonensis TaxID=58919 RepID=A0A316Z3V7_9BASI|nr:hypothetical protein FA09DRAFT_96345 [Tilletiopsis washingtonensis]PWN96241.1 hypothetical protein FA09DRAFT_96345 [Tilletiopsis washingtonensis]